MKEIQALRTDSDVEDVEVQADHRRHLPVDDDLDRLAKMVGAVYRLDTGGPRPRGYDGDDNSVPQK